MLWPVNDRVCWKTGTPPVGKENTKAPFRGAFFLEVSELGKAMDNREQIMARLKEVAKDGRITCSAARQVAEEMKVSPQVIGPLCNELKLKIKGCELGCF